MTPQEELRKRIGYMADKDLFTSLTLLEHMEMLDVSLRDMLATIWPQKPLPPADTRGSDIIEMLRVELRKRIAGKSRGAC